MKVPPMSLPALKRKGLAVTIGSLWNTILLVLVTCSPLSAAGPAEETQPSSSVSGNSVVATNILAAKYFHGDGVPQDYQRAATLFRQTAEHGNEIAQFNLGYMYQNGLGLPVDYGKACVFYQAAAAQGYRPAQEALKILHRYMESNTIATTTQLATHLKEVPAEELSEAHQTPWRDKAELQAWLHRIKPAAGGQ